MSIKPHIAEDFATIQKHGKKEGNKIILKNKIKDALTISAAFLIGTAICGATFTEFDKDIKHKEQCNIAYNQVVATMQSAPEYQAFANERIENIKESFDEGIISKSKMDWEIARTDDIDVLVNFTKDNNPTLHQEFWDIQNERHEAIKNSNATTTFSVISAIPTMACGLATMNCITDVFKARKRYKDSLDEETIQDM
ncbi:MAG: hypothetical protein IJA61_02530 [Clostridia bacterium]|nr:hypothetical protein [Clostridia bacterium]